MLMVAVWMLSRILPAHVTMWLWAVPLVALAVILGRASFRTPGARLASRTLAGVAVLAALLVAMAPHAVPPIRCIPCGRRRPGSICPSSASSPR